MASRKFLMWLLIVILSLTSCISIHAPTSEPVASVAPQPRLMDLAPVLPVHREVTFQPFWPLRPFDPNRPFGPYRFIKAPVPWITDEIVFFGAKRDIEDLLSVLRGENRLSPELVNRFELTSVVGELLQNDLSIRLFDNFFGGPPTQEQLDQSIVADLYRFAQPNDILQLIEIVDGVRNEIARREERTLFAFAEPNFWLTSLQAAQECISVSGKPNSFGNGPFGTGVESAGDMGDFNKQWAFQLLAGQPLSSSPPDPLAMDSESETPNEVNVVIFDNSPFTDIVESTLGTGAPEVRNVELPPTDILPLQVLHWTLGNQAAASSVNGADEHGVFIASLIYKIVPSSTISLVRVLDGAGCGAAYTLSHAIAEFAQKYSNGPRTIFNLSLGIPRSQIELMPRMYLEAVLTNYLAVKDILTIAAAGNEQAPSLLLPAGYVDDTAYRPYVKVVAVEASNKMGKRACFSNRGRDSNGDLITDHAILAPGGDGSNSACSASLIACRNASDCPNGIMGRTHDNRWIFWSGTSFAAPLVSGAAARWLAQGCSVSTVFQHLATSSHIDLTSPPCP